jgi:outer membrane protein
MKNILFVTLLFFTLSSSAQKIAYVDSDFILERIPEYQSAQDQLEQVSLTWQAEIEEVFQEIDQLYKKFQADQILLTQDMKKRRESEIISKEKEAKELQRKRFGPEGDLFIKRKELVQPIQDRVFNAIKSFSEEKRYDIIFDKSSDLTMLYTNTNLDKSEDILKMLGN